MLYASTPIDATESHILGLFKNIALVWKSPEPSFGVPVGPWLRRQKLIINQRVSETLPIVCQLELFISWSKSERESLCIGTTVECLQLSNAAL